MADILCASIIAFGFLAGLLGAIALIFMDKS